MKNENVLLGVIELKTPRTKYELTTTWIKHSFAYLFVIFII